MSNIATYERMKDSKERWLGDIPSTWNTRLLKYMFSIKKNIAGETGHQVLSVTQKGIVPKNMTERGQFSLDYSKYQLVEAGDFVMNHMDLLTGWVDISKYDGVTSPDYRVFVNNNPDSFDSKYYNYIFQYCYSNRIFYGLGQGVAGYGRWRLPTDMFMNFALPVPPIDQQRRISYFLDKQCAQIDSIIEEAKLSVAEYKKWRASIIFEAVTKGLNPLAEMKDSHIDWIGQMPAHWGILSLKYLCSMQAGKNLVSDQIDEAGEYPVYGGNGIRGYYSKYNYEGEYLLVGRQGALCGNVHKIKGCFWATEHAVVTKNVEGVELSFLYYLLNGMNLNRYASNSAAQPGLSVNTIQNIKTVFPPIEEQIEISTYLNDICHSIDSIIENKQSLIFELESYKKSLIFETVTGKRKVV